MTTFWLKWICVVCYYCNCLHWLWIVWKNSLERMKYWCRHTTRSVNDVYEIRHTTRSKVNLKSGCSKKNQICSHVSNLHFDVTNILIWIIYCSEYALISFYFQVHRFHQITSTQSRNALYIYLLRLPIPRPLTQIAKLFNMLFGVNFFPLKKEKIKRISPSSMAINSRNSGKQACHS